METQTKMVQPVSIEKTITWQKELLVCLLLSFTFGIFVCTASNKFVSRENRRSESVDMERNILRGQGFLHVGKILYMPPWQNRVLFPALLELGIHIGVFSPNGWYLIIRFASSIVMFTVL